MIEQLRARVKLQKEFGGEKGVLDKIVDTKVIAKNMALKHTSKVQGPRKTCVVILFKHAEAIQDLAGMTPIQKYDPFLNEDTCIHVLKVGKEL